MSIVEGQRDQVGTNGWNMKTITDYIVPNHSRFIRDDGHNIKTTSSEYILNCKMSLGQLHNVKMYLFLESTGLPFPNSGLGRYSPNLVRDPGV